MPQTGEMSKSPSWDHPRRDEQYPLNATFAAKGQPQAITFPTTGLKQAIALRDWIVEKYTSGDLSAE